MNDVYIEKDVAQFRIGFKLDDIMLYCIYI